MKIVYSNNGKSALYLGQKSLPIITCCPNGYRASFCDLVDFKGETGTDLPEKFIIWIANNDSHSIAPFSAISIEKVIFESKVTIELQYYFRKGSEYCTFSGTRVTFKPKSDRYNDVLKDLADAFSQTGKRIKNCSAINMIAPEDDIYNNLLSNIKIYKEYFGLN